MGQAWCKEKTSKAQDSKSPLDRVFVRCAHRIYPGLKEEGSVLGGATQRVTSSEIGYAGSPPREVLTRGRSIDSVDRPFHPSDWVDVNLEVPSTPRASSVLTNLTVDTSLYPATTPTSSCSNLKDVTPVPPPRRKKRNKGRPLPPKPDEIPENSAGNLRHGDGNEEPLYSSVKSPKTSGDEQDAEEEARTDKSCSNAEDTKHEGKRTKEVYEHKVNGTGKIISSDVVSGRRTSTSEDKKTCRNSETSQHPRKVQENEEYEIFVRNQLIKDSSTPNRQDGRKSKDLVEKQIKDSSRDAENPGINVRTKNYSTVSLPNYDELDVARHQTRRTKDDGGGGEKTKSRRPVRSSTGSLPAESFLSPFSEKTSVRLEDYIPRRGSTDILSPYQVLGKLDCSENGVVDGGFAKYDPSKLEDWDLGDVGNCELNHHRRLSFETDSSMPRKINVEKRFCESGDVVDFALNSETGDREGRSSAERETSGGNITGSPGPLQKPETFGKTSSPASKEMEDSRVGSQNRSQSRYFDPPTLAGTCGASPTPESTFPPASREPFYLDETKHRSALDTIGGSCRNGAISEESDRSEQSRMIFGRSLSNESEPSEDTYEAKELRGHRDVTSKLIRTISEESLPREMVEGQDGLDEFFELKLAKDARDKTRQDRVEEKVRTPPPSPEPRIKAEIQDNDHSTLLKVLKEEAADESNLSSMTPSLTELEAALSDMLEKEEKEEKEDPREEIGKEQDKAAGLSGKTPSQASRYTGKFIEPDIVPVEKNPASFKGENVAAGSTATIETQGRTSDKILVDEDFEESTDEVSVSLGQILEERKGPVVKGRKVSFCAWEETSMAEIDLRNDREFIGRPADLDKRTVSDPKEDRMEGGGLEKVVERISASPVVATSDDNTNYVACPTDFPPEKPSRLHRNPDDSTEYTETSVPTPPRRKHKGSFLVAKGEIETAQNGSTNYKQIVDPYHNDRLI